MDMTLDTLWCRFSRYEIRGGCIRPAEGARGQAYDPSEAYWQARRGGPGEWRRPAQGPHDELLGLVDALELRPSGESPPFALRAESEAKLLEWCSRHGLLGILPHRTIMATIHEEPRKHLHPGMLWSVERRYLWHGGRWIVVWNSQSWARRRGTLVPVDPHPEQVSVPPRGRRLERALAGARLSSSLTWPRPRVVLADLDGADVTEEPLGRTWARFFPDVPPKQRETYPYPVPLTKSFWQQYAEPIEAFVEGALALRTAVNALKASAEAGQREGRAALAALLAPITIGTADEERGPCWASPSLLATFAMMFDQDRRSGRRPLGCDVCGRVFLSGVGAARYCSETCRHTAQKRRWRAKQRRPRRRRTPDRPSGVHR